MKTKREAKERKPNGYWPRWENFEPEMRTAIEENNGKFPTQSRLYEMKKSCLVGAIIHHGGVNAVRVKMGYELIAKPKRYWKDWENFEPEMKKAIKENGGKFPFDKRLREMGYNNLGNAIFRYHGGLNAVRKRMGFKLNRRIPNEYADWKVFEKELKKVIKENKGEFPTAKRLVEMGRSDLFNIIYKHYGGLVAVREKMGYELERKPRRHWEDWKNVKKELKEATKENEGELPSDWRLRELGYGYLGKAIYKYHGGMAAVREKIGYNEQMRIKLAKKLEEVVERMVA